MGLWDSIKKQFIEVIDWTEPGNGILAYRFPVADREIKTGAQLTVRESQAALFVDEGEIADVFGPGRYPLVTENLPVLTKLRSWPHGFDSPFKSDVVFFSLRDQLGQRWGTPAPITVRDPEFGSVQLRMFGVFSYHLTDVKTFFRKVAGTRASYTAAELNPQILGHIASAVATTFASSGIPFLDLAANQAQLGALLKERLQEPAAALGITIDTFIVENVSLPEALQQVLTDKQSLGIMGKDLGTYAQYQMAKSIPDAMKASGGIAGLGAGLGVGASLGNLMGQTLAAGQPAAPAAAPEPQLKGCVGCGKGIAADAQFCRWCGKPQSLACDKCGTPAESGSGFCAKCGNKLG